MRKANFRAPEAPDFAARLAAAYSFIEDAVFEKVGSSEVTPANLLMLARLFKMGGTVPCSTDLRRRGIYGGSNSNYNVVHLVKTGFLSRERRRSDHRFVAVVLTDKGRELGQQAAAELDKLEEGIGKVFSEQAYRELFSYLHLMVR